MNEFDKILVDQIGKDRSSNISNRVMANNIKRLIINYILQPKVNAYSNNDYPGYRHRTEELKSIINYLKPK